MNDKKMTEEEAYEKIIESVGKTDLSKAKIDFPLNKEQKYIEQIKARHFRKTMAHPEGAVGHDADCYIYTSSRICSCGLLHELVTINNPEEIYPLFWDEYDKQKDNLSLIDNFFDELRKKS